MDTCVMRAMVRASTMTDRARQALETGADLYCRWYDTGMPHMEGGAMAYELVTAIRTALALLDAEAAQVAASTRGADSRNADT